MENFVALSIAALRHTGIYLGADPCHRSICMFGTVEIPVWLLTLIVLFAAVTFASHFLFPSVRWFLRRRAERIVDRLNERLELPIQPFKLARRTDTIQRLIYDPQVIQAVQEHARETGVREDVAFETAKRYAREIVPGFSASAYFGIAIRAAKWLSTRLYDVRMGHYDEVQQRAIDGDATVIYVINHRSNMDYVLVTYLVANRSALSYAVGEWARVWPLRPLIRALGGYFIRRRSLSPLYRRVLARYVQMATAAGVTQAVFPEGGLSQTGRLGPPKLGLLNYIVSDFDPASRDVIFVPVALNYDRVVEDTLLIDARKKNERRFRGTIPSATAFVMRYVWRRITRRAQRFGTAGVSFGTPLSLRDDSFGSAEDTASELMRRIANVIPILPVPLVAAALSAVEGRATRETLLSKVTSLSEQLGAAGATLLAEDTIEQTLDKGLLQLTARKIVTEEENCVEQAEGRADLLAFYAASVHEVIDALAETAPADSADTEATKT